MTSSGLTRDIEAPPETLASVMDLVWVTVSPVASWVNSLCQ